MHDRKRVAIDRAFQLVAVLGAVNALRMGTRLRPRVPRGLRALTAPPRRSDLHWRDGSDEHVSLTEFAVKRILKSSLVPLGTRFTLPNVERCGPTPH